MERWGRIVMRFFACNGSLDNERLFLLIPFNGTGHEVCVMSDVHLERYENGRRKEGRKDAQII
jgi:hypothetical protein